MSGGRAPDLPFHLLSCTQAEKLIVEAVRCGYVSARFDHTHNTIHFGGR
jgi:hypothetical protein